jgi:hypothetical protein
VSTLTAILPNSPSEPKSGRALISAASSRCRFPCVDAGRGALPRRVVDEGEVVADAGDPGLVGDRPVAGDDHFDVHPSMRSHAATQLPSGPAHTIGVPPMNKMSPV